MRIHPGPPHNSGYGVSTSLLDSPPIIGAPAYNRAGYVYFIAASFTDNAPLLGSSSARFAFQPAGEIVGSPTLGDPTFVQIITGPLFNFDQQWANPNSSDGQPVVLTYIDTNTGDGNDHITVNIPSSKSIPAGATIFACVTEWADTSHPWAMDTTKLTDTAGNSYSIVQTTVGNPEDAYAQVGVFFSSNCRALLPGNTIRYYCRTNYDSSYAISVFYVTGLGLSPYDPAAFASVANQSERWNGSFQSALVSGIPTTTNELMLAVVGAVSDYNGYLNYTQSAGGWNTPPREDQANGTGSTGAVWSVFIGGGTLINPGGGSVSFSPIVDNADAYGAMILGFIPTVSGIVGSAQVGNLQTTTQASVDYGNARIASAHDGPYATTAAIPVGGTIFVQQNAPPVFDGSNTCVISIGGISESYTVSTPSPPVFSFPTPPLQQPNTAQVTSYCFPTNIVRHAVTASVSGGSNAQISSDGVNWGGTAIVLPESSQTNDLTGSILYVRQDAPRDISRSNVCTVTIEGVSATYTVSTVSFLQRTVTVTRGSQSTTTVSIPSGASTADLYWLDAGSGGVSTKGGPGGQGGSCHIAPGLSVIGHSSLVVRVGRGGGSGNDLSGEPGGLTTISWDSSSNPAINAALTYTGGIGTLGNGGGAGNDQGNGIGSSAGAGDLQAGNGGTVGNNGRDYGGGGGSGTGGYSNTWGDGADGYAYIVFN